MSDNGKKELGDDTSEYLRASTNRDTNLLGPDDLQRLEVLQRVGLPSIWGLLEHCPIVVLRAGDTLLKAGQANQTMYFILEGELRVHLDGEEGAPVATLKAGQTVGELSVIDDRPTSATVKADKHSRMLAVDESTFWRLVEASHEFATNLLLLLAERMRSTNSAVCENIRERRKYEHESRIDGLTGLHNRRWLDETLERLVERHSRDGRSLCVAMMDIDNFKHYNDTYGHQAGDRALVTLSRVVARNLRPTDLAARYGGEEFTVLFPGTDGTGAMIAAERLRQSLAHAPVRLAEGGELPAITVSVGVAELVKEQKSSELLAAADKALLAAKQGGKNRIDRA
jgi:diguanylate cyclase (GGDEF)-like protein